MAGMDEFEDIDAPLLILPGVDLALWLRILVVLAVVITAAVVTVAVR